MNLVTHYGFNERADLSKALTFETVEAVKDWLKTKFSSCCSFGIDNLTRNGNFRLMAINYDFTPWLTKYLIQYEHGQLQAAWAPSKGALRKAMSLSNDDKIFVFPSK